MNTNLHYYDWIIMCSTILFIVVYGIYKTRKNKSVKDFIKGGNEAKWWTIGLSVMATQASAITFLSTPGQAYYEGMGFVQMYLGLPLAMIIVCVVFIPIYYKLNVYTAYEYLESRFDLKTRVLTAFLFLIQRGLATGITIFAPAIILSYVLGWDLVTLNIIIGLLVISYTVAGGTKALNITQKQQMIVIMSGMVMAFVILVNQIPDNISFTSAINFAANHGKMEVLDFSFDINNRYNVWSGIIGGTFLMLSYFGTDQSQVQRYLGGKSSRQSQLGMIFNAIVKVPMQFFILLIGVLLFVFFHFHETPINFNPNVSRVVKSSQYANQYQELENKLQENFNERKTYLYEGFKTEHSEKLLELNKENKKLREQAKEIIVKVDKTYPQKLESNDKDYVFIHFVLNHLPKGIIGILLAVILVAAMSSTASELSALSSTTTIDLYKRNIAIGRSDKHYVNATKVFTLIWGIIAILIACVAHLADNLIQLVNIIGSLFYGNVLGIFLLAFFFKKIKGTEVFIGAIITQILLIAVWYYELLTYLWLNVLGVILVIGIAIILQVLIPKNNNLVNE